MLNVIYKSLDMYGCDFHLLYTPRDSPHKVKSSDHFSALLLNDEWEATGAAETVFLCSKRDGGVGGTKGLRI